MVEANGDEIASYPCNTVDCITLFPGVNVSPRLIKNLAERKKNVFWVDSLGKTYASVSFPDADNIARRKLQFELTDDYDFRLGFARRNIDSKVACQSRLIEKECGKAAADVCEELSHVRKSIAAAQDISVIMGLEGYAARIYFAALAGVLPKEWGFVKRTKHPPRDCFSALLSFTYMLLYNETVSAIRGAGLDPEIGVMHSLGESHQALASDLMEEFRPLICDRLALRIVRSGELTPRDFTYNGDGSVYMNKDSSKKVIAAFSAEMNANSGVRKTKGRGNAWRDVIAIQVSGLVSAMSAKDPGKYDPVYPGSDGGA